MISQTIYQTQQQRPIYSFSKHMEDQSSDEISVPPFSSARPAHVPWYPAHVRFLLPYKIKKSPRSIYGITIPPPSIYYNKTSSDTLNPTGAAPTATTPRSDTPLAVPFGGVGVSQPRARQPASPPVSRRHLTIFDVVFERVPLISLLY